MNFYRFCGINELVCPFLPLARRTCKVKWLKALRHWYLFPWASWRVKHWRRRIGSQWAARRPLGGADTLKAVSRRGSGPPEHTAPRQGPEVHCYPALGHCRHSVARQDSRWMGCPPEGLAGSGTGSNKRRKNVPIRACFTYLSTRSRRGNSPGSFLSLEQ